MTNQSEQPTVADQEVKREEMKREIPPRRQRGAGGGGRHLARELALQALYQCEISGDPMYTAVDQLSADQEESSRADLAYFRQLAISVHNHRQSLDEWITRVAANWSLERVSIIDRNILRLGIYELLHQSDVPLRVVINEAIELAKRFGGEGSGRFVNGIMDRVAEEVRPVEVAANHR